MGFSETAVEMVHNVLRGQGAALLFVSAYLFVQGPRERNSFLLISLTCFTAALCHIVTMNHHKNNAIVMKAVESISPLYGMIGINVIIGGLAALVYSRL